MFIQKGLIFTFMFVFATPAFAGAVCNSLCNILGQSGATGTISITEQGAKSSLFVDGNLYLDYSIFSIGEELIIPSGASISAQTLAIYSYSATPAILEEEFSTYDILNLAVDFTGEGTWVLFANSPLNIGSVEATGNLYIGNYSNVAMIPLPAAICLYLSGIGLLRLLTRHTANKQKHHRAAGCAGQPLRVSLAHGYAMLAQALHHKVCRCFGRYTESRAKF